MPKVEVRFRKTFQVRPYESETIELCIWEDVCLGDAPDESGRPELTRKDLSARLVKLTAFQGQIFQAMSAAAADLVSERLAQQDPRSHHPGITGRHA